MEHEGTSLPIVRVLAVITGTIPDESGPQLNKALSEAAEDALDALLVGTPVVGLVRGRLKIHRSFVGSWVIDATLNLWTGASWAFGILETASKLPKIIEGLNSLEGQIAGLFARKASELVPSAATRVAAVPVAPPLQSPTSPSPQSWCVELSSHIGARVVLKLRGTDSHLAGVLVSCDPYFVRLKDDRHATVVTTSDLVAFESYRDDA